MDFASNDIYFFSLFVTVYVYASEGDFVCIALLLPFVLGSCLSVFSLFCFFYFKKNFLNNCLIFLILITLFYFILSSFLLSFFLPFI